MITDTISDATCHTILHPDFAKAFHPLQTLDFANLPDGQVPCEDPSIRIFIDSEPVRTQDGTKPEAHLKHISIQTPIDGNGTYGQIDRDCLENGLGYNEKHDIEFLDYEPETWLTSEPGKSALFFSDDMHAPLVGDRANIRRIIFKIRIETERL